MRRRYEDELAELPATYRSVASTGPLDEVVACTAVSRPMIFLGSGGAFAIARLAADLHMRATGELAIATTPLELAGVDLDPRVGVVLFSARGRNPDAATAVSAARSRGAEHIGVVTCRSRQELAPVLGAGDVHVATVPAPPDGFLATNSLIAMSTAICRAYGWTLPTDLPAFSAPDHSDLRSSLVVVTGPGTSAVGADMEARLVETGVARVQVADYRNLAHGRHVGLLRNSAETTIVSIVEPSTAELARRTLRLFPDDFSRTELRSELPWPACVLDLFVGSMRIANELGRSLNVDVGRPGVAPFGRDLYHLPIGRLIPKTRVTPSTRKALASGLGAASTTSLETAYVEWLDLLRRQIVTGLVLDYDGTCLPTWDRFRPPAIEVQNELIRLVQEGLVLGFASGRGRSLVSDTQTWLPRAFWPSVHVGLYNGSVQMRLDEAVPEAADCSGDLLEAAERLQALAWPSSITIERRERQVTVGDSSGRMSSTKLLHLIQSVLSRAPKLACLATASGHSVDIISQGPDKTSVLGAISAAGEGTVVAIGDQGAVGGNDFELLAATQFSLTVDRCSGDPTRCWNLDEHGVSGSALLLQYLKALRPAKLGHRFVWRTQ